MITVGLYWFNVEIPKRAFRFYERGDLEKTVEALDKSLEKDSINPAGNYLYARLYVDTAFARYNVDTAYQYINEAIADFGYITEQKDFESLQDVGVDSASMELHKDLIDSLQFELIRARHTIADYNWFQQTHQDAIQIPEAIRLRNHIAFEDASRTDTWQSYLAFMNQYPEADDFEEAETRYKKLIFEARTADGKLQSYTDFLEEFPGTPYREIAEQEIFIQRTAVNTIEAYTDFLKQYPNEKIARKILPRLYHLYKQDFEPDTFFDYFDLPRLKDSLSNVIALEKGFWMPRLQDGKISFFDAEGKIKLENAFESVTDDYKCSPVFTDFVMGTKNGKQQLYGRNGRLIYEGIFDRATDKGYGYVAIENIEGSRLVHKSGEVILDLPYESVAVLSQHFIRTEKDGKFGLTTIHQKQVLAHEYDQIDTLQGYLWLEKDGLMALTRPEALFPAILDKPVKIDLIYEDIELLQNGTLLAIKEGKEGILDLDLNVVIPFDNHSPYDRDYGWLIEKEATTRLLHKHYPFLRDSTFDKVEENHNWIGLKKDSAWTLLDMKGQMAIAEGYDSLAFWGENMVMLFKNDSVLAQFRNGRQLLMEKGWDPKLLIPQNYVKTGEPALFDYFMLTGPKDYRKVYNSTGKEILSATYKEVTAMGPNLLRLQKRNTALVDSTGNFVLKFIYDGVGSYDKGYVSILKSGKVGILNIAKDLTIPPTYDNLITPYADTVLVARKGKYMGFINDQNKALSGFDFDEVRYWNDTIALTRIEQEWLLHNISAETAEYEGMTQYEILIDRPEEKRILVTKASGKGIYSSTKGELIDPTFNEIIQLGTVEQPIYFAVKIVAEANIYVVIYYDGNGNKLFTQTYQQDTYFNIACPGQ
jgi:tetratricopeptide (TPR) repeat protein